MGVFALPKGGEIWYPSVVNVFDLITLTILAALTLRGIWKGMVSQIVSVASYFVCWIVATRFGSLVAPTIPVEPPWDQVLAMGIVFLITLVAIRFAHAALEQLIKHWHLQKLNTLFGGALGFTKGLLICLIITFFAVMVSETSRDVVFHSKSGFHLVRLTTQIGMFVPKDSYEFVHTQFAHFQDKVDEAIPGKMPEMMQVQSSETFQQLREKTEASAGSLFAALSQWWHQGGGGGGDDSKRDAAEALAEVASPIVQTFTPQMTPREEQRPIAETFVPPMPPSLPPPMLPQGSAFTNIPPSATPRPTVAVEPFFIRQPEANTSPSVVPSVPQALTPLPPSVSTTSAPQISSLSALTPLPETLQIPPEPVTLLPLMPMPHHIGSDLLLRNSTQPANPNTPARVFRP